MHEENKEHALIRAKQHISYGINKKTCIIIVIFCHNNKKKNMHDLNNIQ